MPSYVGFVLPVPNKNIDAYWRKTGKVWFSRIVSRSGKQRDAVNPVNAGTLMH